MNETAWAAKQALETAKGQFYRGEISQDDLRAKAQVYVEALAAYKRGNPKAKKLRIPTVAQLLR